MAPMKKPKTTKRKFKTLSDAQIAELIDGWNGGNRWVGVWSRKFGVTKMAIKNRVKQFHERGLIESLD